MAKEGQEDTLTFGPPGEQWLYSRKTKTYDLARGAPASAKFTLRTTRGPSDTSIAIDPAAAALVVVDMQNYFLDARCRDHPTGLATVEPTIRVIEKCRQVGIQIVWLNWGLTDADLASMPASVQRGFSGSLIAGSVAGRPGGGPLPRTGLGADLGEGRGRTLVAGSWNAEIYGPLAGSVRDGDDDVHCAKNRMSGLWCEEQPLWRYLEGEGRKRTLLFTGVNTDQCVLGTLSNAYNAGWDCVMVEDCCATTTEDGHSVCLHNVSNSYGFVVDSESIVAGSVG